MLPTDIRSERNSNPVSQFYRSQTHRVNCICIDLYGNDPQVLQFAAQSCSSGWT